MNTLIVNTLPFSSKSEMSYQEFLDLMTISLGNTAKRLKVTYENEEKGGEKEILALAMANDFMNNLEELSNWDK